MLKNEVYANYGTNSQNMHLAVSETLTAAHAAAAAAAGSAGAAAAASVRCGPRPAARQRHLPQPAAPAHPRASRRTRRVGPRPWQLTLFPSR